MECIVENFVLIRMVIMLVTPTRPLIDNIRYPPLFSLVRWVEGFFSVLNNLECEEVSRLPKKGCGKLGYFLMPNFYC